MLGSRPILLIVPVLPAAAGNGLAMRAGLFLDALARRHAVTVLVVPAADPDCDGTVPDFVAVRARRCVIQPLATHVDPLFDLIMRLKEPAQRSQALAGYPLPLLFRHATAAAVRDAMARLGDASFDIVHVMRLYMAPFAAPFLGRTGGRPVCTLDVDDIESQTHERLAALQTGEAAQLSLAEAGRYRRMEAEWLPRFDRVLVCSDLDATALAGGPPMRPVTVLPNAIALPSLSPAAPAGAIDCLFVGSMGYLPNADAACLFCESVLPALRASVGRAPSFAIVGSRPTDSVAALAAIAGVTVTGRVDEVASWYARARVVVVPLRAGGGTRIKLIEAFAHGRPVVSTTVGAEGIAARDGEHLLIADEPMAFAAACARLLADRDLASALARRARRLVADRYDAGLIAARILRLFDELVSSTARRNPA